MLSWLSTALMGAGAFVATNLDDLLILGLLFASPAFRNSAVVGGQLLGMLILTGTSLLGAAGGRLLPDAVVGLLGLLPLAYGVKMLRAPEDQEEVAAEHALAEALPRGILTVTAMTVANGGDNLGVYIPLFTTHEGLEVAMMASLFMLLTLVWCALGYGLVSHPELKPRIEKYGHRILPWVLVVLGLSILLESFWIGPALNPGAR